MRCRSARGGEVAEHIAPQAVRKVVTTVNIRSTKRLPASLCVPNDVRRHITARRSARSARLFVGSTPSTRTNVQSASPSERICRHVPLVLACAQSLPASSNARVFCSTADIARRNLRRDDVPSLT